MLYSVELLEESLMRLIKFNPFIDEISSLLLYRSQSLEDAYLHMSFASEYSYF